MIQLCEVQLLPVQSEWRQRLPIDYVESENEKSRWKTVQLLVNCPIRILKSILQV